MESFTCTWGTFDVENSCCNKAWILPDSIECRIPIIALCPTSDRILVPLDKVFTRVGISLSPVDSKSSEEART